MKGIATLMASARTGEKAQDEWCTPRWLFDRCVKEFGGFDLDAAASDENYFCARWYTEQDNAIACPWYGNVWCNPPHSMLREFADKAIEQLSTGNCQSATFLIPARTDTRAFQAMAKHASDIVFLAGRVKFEPGTQSAPFPSAIVHLVREKMHLTRVVFQDWRPVRAGVKK